MLTVRRSGGRRSLQDSQRGAAPTGAAWPCRRESRIGRFRSARRAPRTG